MADDRTAPQVFWGVSALLFAASATLTADWGAAMANMGGMPMPGGWTMSPAWMPMPGQTWTDVAASFIGMWLLMMIAMMLPSLAPNLWRYRQTVGGRGATRPGRLTALAGIGYFSAWAVCGVVVFPLGTTLTGLAMRQPMLARAVPMATGVVVVIAGALQFSAWKAHHLACCRQPWESDRAAPVDAATAFRHGLRLGLHCIYDGAGFTAILLVTGVMDLRVMAAVTAAITAERLAPNGPRIAKAIGMVTACAGLLLLTRAATGLT